MAPQRLGNRPWMSGLAAAAEGLQRQGCALLLLPLDHTSLRQTFSLAWRALVASTQIRGEYVMFKQQSSFVYTYPLPKIFLWKMHYFHSLVASKFNVNSMQLLKSFNLKLILPGSLSILENGFKRSFLISRTPLIKDNLSLDLQI